MILLVPSYLNIIFSLNQKIWASNLLISVALLVRRLYESPAKACFLALWRAAPTLSQSRKRCVKIPTVIGWTRRKFLRATIAANQRVALTKPVGVCWRGSARALIDVLRLTGAPEVFKPQLYLSGDIINRHTSSTAII